MSSISDIIDPQPSFINNLDKANSVDKVDKVAETNTSSDDGLPYWLLMLFLFLLCGAVQSAFPALEIVRPAQVTAIFVIVAGILRKITQRQPLVMRAPSYFFIGLMSVTLIGVPIAIWPGLAFATATDGLKMLIIFLIISNVIFSVEKIRGLCWAMCLGGLLPAMGTLKNYATGQNLVDGFRAAWVGFFGNPNDLAYVMAMLVPLAMALMTTTKKLSAKLMAAGCMAIFTLTIIATFSRIGFLCLVIIGAMTLLRSEQKVRNLMLMLVLMICCLPFVSTQYLERVQTISTYKQDESSMGRIQSWDVGLTMFENNPFVGVGAGCYLLGWPEELRDKYKVVRTAHNTIIQSLGEVGFLGTLCFCLFLISSWAVIWKLRRALLRQRRELEPAIFKEQFGNLLTMVVALDIGLWVFFISSLTGGLLFTWYPYLFSAMGIAAAEAYKRKLAAIDNTENMEMESGHE